MMDARINSLLENIQKQAETSIDNIAQTLRKFQLEDTWTNKNIILETKSDFTIADNSEVIKAIDLELCTPAMLATIQGYLCRETAKNLKEDSAIINWYISSNRMTECQQANRMLVLTGQTINNKVILGFLRFEVHHSKRRDVTRTFITCFEIVEKMRRMGYGLEMCREMEDYLLQNKMPTKVELFPLSDAIKFWEKMGYKHFENDMVKDISPVIVESGS